MTDLERLLERMEGYSRLAREFDRWANGAEAKGRKFIRLSPSSARKAAEAFRLATLPLLLESERAKLALPQKDSGTGVTPEARSAERP